MADNAEKETGQDAGFVLYHMEVLLLVRDIAFFIMPVDVPTLSNVDIGQLLPIDLEHF